MYVRFIYSRVYWKRILYDTKTMSILNIYFPYTRFLKLFQWVRVV